MKCPKCGAELSDNSKFCSYCGLKIMDEDLEVKESNVLTGGNRYENVKNESSSEPESYLEGTDDDQQPPEQKITLGDKLKAKIAVFWESLDFFCKTLTVMIVAIAVLLFVSLCAGNEFAVFFSILQIGGIIAALLMHKGVIKLEQKKTWYKYLVLLAIVLFTVLNIMSYSWGKDSDTYQPSGSETEGLVAETIPTTAIIPMGLEDCVDRDFNLVEKEFRNAGFVSVEVRNLEDIKNDEADKLYTVGGISVGGSEQFTKGQKIDRHDEVIISYHGYKKCNIKIHVDFIPNLMFNRYDVNFLLNGHTKGTLPHGENKDFEFTVDPGEYTLVFENDDSYSVQGEVSLIVDCDMEAGYKIACYTDKISVQELYIDKNVELADDEVKLDVPVSEYKFKNYTDVETAIRSLGFTNVKYNIKYDIVLGLTEDGEVADVSIAGNNDFRRGDIFKRDSEVVITYHMKEEDDPNRQTEPTDLPDVPTEEPELPRIPFYTTNDYETAKKGNTGVFAYCMRGNAYDQYYIIDFDEGYVYYFIEGEQHSDCDRLKIESGTLNDIVTVTYHEGGDAWSNGLHFKYVNHPEMLIMNDQDGFYYEFSTTSLSNSLSLRANKTIKDY